MPCICKVALIVNCGYARVCIYENSDPRNGRIRKTIDTQKRLANFKSQFSTYPAYGIPTRYFEAAGKGSKCQFDRDCDKILDGFNSADIGLHRNSYLFTFSLANWSALPSTEKKEHTLSNCTRCFEVHEQQQHFFPLKPFYQPESVVKVDEVALTLKPSLAM